jgi:outer membrane protein assembly factor BamA
VDGIIGFLPNEEEGLRITGQAELELNNLFNSGKSFQMSWQRMRPETQRLFLSYYHTNLLRTRLDVGLNFNLLKEDSTFINRNFNISLDYSTGPHSLFFISRIKSARLLETSRYEDITELPDVADFNLNDYGVGYHYLDVQPGWLGQYGLDLQAEAALGNKKIRRNAGLPPEIYEGIDLNSLQGRAEFSGQWGIRVGKQSLFVQRYSAGWMGGENLFLNDLYRLGGFRTIRGFNENEFYAQYYGMINLEWQFYVGESSNIMVFMDQAWLKDLSQSDNPTGVGVGATLQTGAGLLQLAYAVGRARENPFDIQKSKFHFGYIARF